MTTHASHNIQYKHEYMFSYKFEEDKLNSKVTRFWCKAKSISTYSHYATTRTNINFDNWYLLLRTWEVAMAPWKKKTQQSFCIKASFELDCLFTWIAGKYLISSALCILNSTDTQVQGYIYDRINNSPSAITHFAIEPFSQQLPWHLGESFNST